MSVVEKIYTKYHISQPTGHHIYAKVSKDEISLETATGVDRFWFKRSDPMVVQTIAEFMLEAVKLSRNDVHKKEKE